MFGERYGIVIIILSSEYYTEVLVSLLGGMGQKLSTESQRSFSDKS